MKVCPCLSAVLLILTAFASSIHGTSVHGQDVSPDSATTPSEASPSDTQVTPEAETGDTDAAPIPSTNPFITQDGSESAVTATDSEVPTERNSEPGDTTDEEKENTVAVEEITTPEGEEIETEEILMPATSPNTENPETGMPKVHFEAPVATQSDRRISQERVAQLRQQRALYRANQRMARMEYNLWMGREPLRPAWNPMPMMSSRYAPPTIVVPVFINPR